MIKVCGQIKTSLESVSWCPHGVNPKHITCIWQVTRPLFPQGENSFLFRSSLRRNINREISYGEASTHRLLSSPTWNKHHYGPICISWNMLISNAGNRSDFKHTKSITNIVFQVSFVSWKTLNVLLWYSTKNWLLLQRFSHYSYVPRTPWPLKWPAIRRFVEKLWGLTRMIAYKLRLVEPFV